MVQVLNWVIAVINNINIKKYAIKRTFLFLIIFFGNPKERC